MFGIVSVNILSSSSKRTLNYPMTWKGLGFANMVAILCFTVPNIILITNIFIQLFIKPVNQSTRANAISWRPMIRPEWVKMLSCAVTPIAEVTECVNMYSVFLYFGFLRLSHGAIALLWKFD